MIFLSRTRPDGVSLRVGIYAPLNAIGITSGLGQYVTRLTSALATLDDDSLPSVEYVVVTDDEHTDWLEPVARERMQVAAFDRTTVHRDASPLFEELQVDVAHVMLPVHIAADCPTVFNPHDLRHVRYPEYYDNRTLQRRRRAYPAACRDATLLDTFSQATKENVVETYDVDAGSVYPMPLGPAHTRPVGVDDSRRAAVRATYDLPERFLLYPANTWPHKNHRLLVDALEHIEKTHGEHLPLVCTGGRDDRGISSEHRIEDLEALDPVGRVHDLGFVDTSHLRALYRECRLLVYPSQFEGGGLPVIEGWQFDTPVVCSDIPPLREKGGNAALFFDPTSAVDIGETVYEAWTDPTLRETLARRGRERRDLFTWERTARAYHALYRKADGRDLSDADKAALAYPPGES